MLDKAFNMGEEIRDLRVVQAILLVASIRCNSNYCYVFHSLIMNTLNISKDDIKYITENRVFPDSMDELKKYDEFLNFAFFRKNIYINDDYSYISNANFENSAEAVRDLMSILIVSDFLLMLTVAFDSEVNLKSETVFSSFPTYDLVSDYVKYFVSQKNMDIEDNPVFSICSYCKSVKNQQNSEWEPIENMIAVLPKNAMFSHGICRNCMERAREDVERRKS